ncbi:MAG: DUF5331 domain-containing protein [Aulosira sp. ZfuVER01]|nr:DUF5331 domain-containing protein [Aulosira sp. ZfuVER01]MDZ7996528.1 DUF5331 domain-containing protein [Aulosira sp. DedVER01a]MDZ8056363.1 DUF5331 domain-containing protein [Aulosira sp. ZfuCHP01]
MNIQQLRQSLKMKWLSYYEQNRPWLVKMRIWGTYDGLRRPSSGFILATLSVLEPQFDQILSFLIELNNNPDQIVTALGLNFNPDKELGSFTREHFIAHNHVYNAPPEEIHDEQEPVLLDTFHPEVNSESPTKILHFEKPATELVLPKIPIPSVTVTHAVVRDRQSESSVAVATQVNRDCSTTMLLDEKPSDEMILQDQPGRSLTIPTEVPNKSTIVTSQINAEIPHQTQTLLPSATATALSSTDTNLKSLAVTIKVPSNSQPMKMKSPDSPHKVKLSRKTNARSLASWVDEFCQGADWDPAESIFIHF